MANQFEGWRDEPTSLPSLEQLYEYRDLMIDILHRQGRGVRHARVGERARTRIGTEYYLPGAFDEERVAGKHDAHPPRLERQRRYSASFREAVGDTAGRLLVLESDSVYLPAVDSYTTKRRMYRFSWDDEWISVFQSEVLPIDIVSDARTDGEVLVDRRENGDDRLIVTLDHERTVESFDVDKTTGYHSDVNIWRSQENPWEPVSEAGFDGLLGRTDEYGREYIAYLEQLERAA